MSYKCQACKKSQPNYSKPSTVVLEKREKIYSNKIRDPETGFLMKDPETGLYQTKETKGWEIVKEIKTCGCVL